MFTGIVEEVGRVREANETGLSVEAPLVTSDAKLGDSICINGVCLTIARLGDRWFGVDTVPETLRRSNLGTLRAGARVNLERSLAANGRLGGHFVQGHVDGRGTVVAVEAEGDTARMVTIEAPEQVMRYVVEKGFIAVDGTSLTVVDRTDRSFRLTLIPYTMVHTIAGDWAPSSVVNLEADVLAKYVEALGRLAARGSGHRSAWQPGTSTDLDTADDRAAHVMR